MKNFILIILVLLSSATVFSQENKNDFGGLKKNAISFTILGTTPVIGLTYERIISNYVSLEIGVGLPSVGIGAKVFFSKIQEQKMMFNTGLTATYVDFGNGYLLNGNAIVIYLPIGLSYYGLKGFNFGVDIGPGLDTGNEDGTILIPYAGLKLGKRF
ncbi:hypothetical protein [Flavobacterium sp. WC2430]|uniref:hypothetical protein n=1 Tax=Flavobacterium sp. WC2430 TaxID=3234137 RepID=UPI003465E7F6